MHAVTGALEMRRGGATVPASWESVVGELVANRGESLLRYAALVSGSPDDAADLVQDALVRTFGRLRGGQSIHSAEAYVRRAIVNAHLDGGRRATRWRRIAHLAVEPERMTSPASETDSRIDIAAELRRLSPRERACIVLRYYEDLKVDDVAETLGISTGAVKRYLSDALAKLADTLDEGGHR